MCDDEGCKSGSARESKSEVEERWNNEIVDK